jgi:hypothetical protein
MLAAASELAPAQQLAAFREAASRFPRVAQCWAELGDRAADDITAYAFYRVGYHRGLDALRAAGWKGSGYVRWSQPTNRGFLRCLDGLGRLAAAIGESDEVERINTFRTQLDPSWDRQS